MKQRTWAVTLAAVLLAASAVAIAGNVQGQDFERKGAIEAPGTAYNVEWESDDPGKLRLSLDPAEDAVSPHATLSIFEGTERVGTYTLDEDWPRLDQQIEPGADHTLVVHRAYQAEVDVLAEEGHPVDIDRFELATETADLVEGENEAIRTQIALDLDDPFAHLSLAFEGQAEDLTITAFNEDDETVLEATADTIDTTAGQALVPTLTPKHFQTGNLLVQVEIAELDGTLDLGIHTLEAETSNVVQTHQDPTASDGNSSQAPDDGSDEQDGTEDNSASTADVLRKVTDLPVNTPIAVTVPEGVETLHLVAEDGCGEAIVFGPDDEVVATAPVTEEDRSEEPNASDEHDPNRSRDRTYTAEIPVETSGEHVVFFTNAHEAADLLMRVDSIPEHRTLETKEVAGELSESNGTLLGSSNASATETVETGLLGFHWESQGIDARRTVELSDPSGDTIYRSEGMGASSLKVVSHGENTTTPLVGPSGDYTVETESTSVGDEGMAYALVTYVR